MDKMGETQWKQLDAVRRIKQAALTVVQAAQLLGLSERQVQRLKRAVEKRGARGVVHGNTGRSPAHRLKASIRKRIVALMRGKYAGFNDQHFTEKLVEVEKIQVSRRTVQRLLRAAGIGAVRKRRPPKHRRRRDRKPQAGLMILWDGSRHDWLEGRGPMLCLMGAIDDATSDMLPGAHFVEQECAAGYLKVLLAIAREKGLPWSAYMDRHSSLKRNDNFWTLEEELCGKQDPTQVLRALELLDVEVIYALSPQAKGRIERLWGTAQDRLTSELRLVNAKTVEEANAVLGRYPPDHNRRFAVPPLESEPAWRPVRKGLDLERTCSFHYEATVSNDNAVRLTGAPIIDIPSGPGKRSYAKARVEVRQFLDGSWRVYLRDALIATVASATAAAPGELRALKRRKRSATAQAFRRGVQRIAASLP
jgi:transposase